MASLILDDAQKDDRWAGLGITMKANEKDKHSTGGNCMRWKKKKESSWAGAENIFREVGARAKNIKLDYFVEDLKYHRGTD